MENLLKGYLTSILGLIGILAIGAHETGFFEFPNPDFLNKEWESLIALIICFGLFRLPSSKIEAFIDSLVQSVVDRFKK